MRTGGKNVDKLASALKTELPKEFVVFPAIPWSDGGLDVDWPDDDINGFLAVARSLDVRLLYLRTEVAQSDSAGQHNGDVAELSVAFSHGGILHIWNVRADWWQSTLDSDPVRIGAATDDDEAGPDAGQLETWAREVANSQEFQRAKTQMGRERATRRLIPDIELLAAERGHFPWRVTQLAYEIYLEDIQPEQDRALGREAQALLASGLKKYQVAARLRVGETRLNRILALSAEDS